MTRLVLKGHSTRGTEVIDLLETLGANRLGYKDTFVGFYYYIECGAICSSDECPIDAKVFTLEEFLEKFPYKVGDKVTLDKFPCEIKGMSWEYDDIIYYVKGADFSKGVYSKDKDLQPYKEETMEDKGTLEQIDLTRELCIADEVEVILGDYEFVLKDGKTYFVKKNKYPKTYDECLKILGYNIAHIIPMNHGHNGLLMMKLQRLLIFRDAYWKIAGKEMGLDKPWKPDWTNFKVNKFCIGVDRNITSSCDKVTGNKILAFPTAEMRDAFYENFKDLIHECKELL